MAGGLRTWTPLVLDRPGGGAAQAPLPPSDVKCDVPWRVWDKEAAPHAHCRLRRVSSAWPPCATGRRKDTVSSWNSTSDVLVLA